MRATVILVLGFAACGGDAADVVVAPEWDGARVEVPRTSFGHNTVWSRGGLGIWDEAAGDVDAAVWPHVEALAPGALRFPGGTRALRWHFAGTIGDARVPQCDAFTGELDATGYGMAEMMGVAQRADAAVSLVTPLSDGTPDEAAAMLGFAEDAGADVQLVEIGNEPYLHLAVGPAVSCGRDARFRQDVRWEGDVAVAITAADYAAQLTAHAAALRAVDPDVVIGAAAMDELDGVATNDAASGDAWNPRLAADAGGAFDAWVIHPYDFSALDERALLAERARETSRGLRELADRPVAVTEFGTLFDGDTMLNAILTADFVRVSVEEQWLVLMRHILIEDDPTEPFATSAAILGPELAHTPGWEVSRALAANLRGEAAPVEVAADDLVALATVDPSGDDIAIVLIDRRLAPDDPVRSVELRLPFEAWGGGVTQIAARGLTSRDVTVDVVERLGNEPFVVDIPPTSVTIVRLATTR